jgi:hypothetical protein
MRKLKIFLLMMIVILPCAILFGCVAQQNTISFPQQNKTILVDQTYDLEVSFGKYTENVKYSVADKAVAIILPNGRTVLGIKQGKTKIYARTDSGAVAEMLLTVNNQKTQLSAPVGLSFNGETRTLSWVNVLNANSYDVRVSTNGEVKNYEVLSNSFSFDNVDLNYIEYQEYIFEVRAKASTTSIAFLNSQFSQPLTYKQLPSVQNLRYDIENGKIIFDYDDEWIDLEYAETGHFVLNILKDGQIISYANIALDNLVGGEIQFNFVPVDSGNYSVRVYVSSNQVTDSIVKEIQIIKLAAPALIYNGGYIEVQAESGTLLKYFKTVDGLRSEIGVGGLSIGDLADGDVVVVETYAYRQSSPTTFYINSDLASITIEKLLPLENLRLEKGNGNNSFKVVWDHREGVECLATFLDGVRIEQYIVEEHNGYYILEVPFTESFTRLPFYVYAYKDNEPGKVYIKSSSTMLEVMKLNKPNVEYEESTGKFKINNSELNIGSRLEFQAEYQSILYELAGGLEITNLQHTVTLSGLNVNQAGVYEIKTHVTRMSSAHVLYLDSNEMQFNIIKLSNPALDYTYSGDDLIVSWAKVPGANLYEILLKNITSNITIPYDDFNMTESNGIVSIQISNLGNATEYEVWVRALSLMEFDQAGNKIIKSENSILEIIRLAAPSVTVEKEGTDLEFAWQPVANATSYDIYLDGQFLISTTGNSCVVGNWVGEHLFSVIAKNNNNNEFMPSRVDINVNGINFYGMSAPANISYERKSQTESIISFDQVTYAGGYRLEIKTPSEDVLQFNSYELRNGRVYFNVSYEIFNSIGDYTFYAYATNPQSNMATPLPSNKVLTMLEGVSAIYIDEDNQHIHWEYSGSNTPSGFDIFINSVLVTDYNFKDINDNIQMNYYVGDLQAGVYNIKIMAKGDNDTTIDSLPVNMQIYKKENLESPNVVGFEISSSNPLESNFQLTFNSVVNAAGYRVYLVDDIGVIYYVDIVGSLPGTKTVALSREVFAAGKRQYLYVIAYPSIGSEVYAQSSIPSFDDINRVVRVYKSNPMTQLDVIDESIVNLPGIQAYVSGVLHTDSYTLPPLSDGQSINIQVRNCDTLIDDGNFGGIFYMASEWMSFQFNKLARPTVTIDDEYKLVSWSELNSSYTSNYRVRIDFYGKGGEDIVKSVILTLNKEITSLTFSQIRNYISESEELFDYVGDYSIYIQSIAIAQLNQIIYLSSQYSSNQTDLIISGILSNGLVECNTTSEGIVTLKFKKLDGNFINYLSFFIEQNEETALIYLFKNGAATFAYNDLPNEFPSGFFEVDEDSIYYYLRLDLFNVVNSGTCTICYRIEGDYIYSTPPLEYAFVNAQKLATPVLEYSNDENGNYININSSVLETYDQNVTVYAEYNQEILIFNNGRLMIPHSWLNVSEIYVYAVSSTSNVFRSEKRQVQLTLYNSVTNLRLENEENPLDSHFDTTFLRWSSNSGETAWVVYIYQNSALLSTNLVTSCQLELTPQLLANPGNYKFVVVAYGNNSTIFNSIIMEFNAIKLSAASLALGNLNGIVNWGMSVSDENFITNYRLLLPGNTKLTFNKSIHTYGMEPYSGMFTIQVRAVGDTSKNIISSDYTDPISFYKFNAPETFNISGGWFAFGDEEDDYITENLLRISIGGNTYSYLTQAGMDSIFDFYTSSTLQGDAYAYVEGGNTINIGGVTVLTLNSNVSNVVPFTRLTIESDSEEKYLTQEFVDDEFITKFNWTWAEAGEISTRMAILYIRPLLNVIATEMSGWNRVLKANGYLDYYYKVVTVLANYDEGEDYTNLSVVQDIPLYLSQGNYSIEIQKTDSAMGGGTLSSKIGNGVKFYQLTNTALLINSGRLNWNNVTNATGYKLLYTGAMSGVQDIIGTVNHFELTTYFADALTSKSYNFRIIPLGNVPVTRPDNIPDEEYVYIVAGRTSVTRNIVKPRTAGSLILNDGGLQWNETYHYFRSVGQSLVEFVLLNASDVEIARVIINGNEFDTYYPNKENLLDKWFSSVALVSGTIYHIKYRELGTTSFANSEYRDLTNSEGGLNFKIAPTISYIGISEEEIIWTPISVPLGDLTSIKYDIYFRLYNDQIVYATTLTVDSGAQGSCLIRLSDLQNLTAFQTHISSINRVFVVVRGNNGNYISGFSSQPVYVKAIEGQVGLYIEEGKLKWNNVVGAAYYELQTIINNQTIIYKVLKNGAVYQVTKYVDGMLVQQYTSSNISLIGNVWSWDIALDENITSGIDHAFKIRFLPQAEVGDYAIPGKYSEPALNVFKLNSPNVSVTDGYLTWNLISNAIEYQIFVEYVDGLGERIGDIKLFKTTLNYYYLDLEDRGQSRINIAVRAIGPSGSINGKYYINSQSVYGNVAYKSNSTLSNLSLSGDHLTWEDTSSDNVYEVVVYSLNNEDEIILMKRYTTNVKLLDLSTLNLDPAGNYYATVKIKGSTGAIGVAELSSISVGREDFKILPLVEEIVIYNGEIRWKAVEEQTYKIIIRSSYLGNVYNYIIGVQDGVYGIVNAYKNGNLISFENTVSPSIDGSGYLYFWPRELEENYSCRISIVLVGGGMIEETYYISSNPLEIGSEIIKSIVGYSSINYNHETKTLSWTRENNFNYNIVITKLIDGQPVTVKIVYNHTTNSLVLDTALETGTYTVSIQKIPKQAFALNLKSNYKNFTIIVP